MRRARLQWPPGEATKSPRLAAKHLQGALADRVHRCDPPILHHDSGELNVPERWLSPREPPHAVRSGVHVRVVDALTQGWESEHGLTWGRREPGRRETASSLVCAERLPLPLCAAERWQDAKSFHSGKALRVVARPPRVDPGPANAEVIDSA